jgi:ATP-dependent Lhr-like helicase
MPSPHLASFCPALRTWFEHLFSAPTPAQIAAWPILQRGEHLLLAAPTGQGKTLGALLPVLEELLRNSGRGGRCLYISPMRALCNDVAARLETHLHEICHGTPGLPVLTVGSWTGDTSARQRQRLRQEPPPLAITTPESLALWLTHEDGRIALSSLRWIIVDEVHSLAGTKRGADLSITLERLAQLARHEPQRIGLSATCSPLEEIARWLGGIGREVRIAAIADQQRWELQIEHIPDDESFLATLLERLPPLLAQATSTLIFTNSRWLAERLTWLLRRRFPQWTEQIAAHHGSLSADAREQAEQGLQSGRLRAVVSSTSLELGVDIGSVEQVILLHPPGGVARLLQRLGRSGHTPTGCRRGILFTNNLTEALEAVVTRAAGELTQLEPLTVPSHPLDVLCQQLIGMGVQDRFTAVQAWSLVRRAYPFRDLPLADFAECLAYVTGKRANVAVPARLQRQEHFFAATDRTTVRIYRQNLGVIVPEPIRAVSTVAGQPVGQINDFFADRLRPGDCFLLQGRSWEVKQLRLSEVEVTEAAGLPAFTRWEGGPWQGPQALAERVWWFRCRIKEALLEGLSAAVALLQQEYHLDAALAQELAAWCDDQEQCSEVPATPWLIETCPLPGTDLFCHALHAPLGPAAAAGLAELLAWRLRHCGRIGTVVGLLGCGLLLPEGKDLSAEQWRELLSPQNAASDLEKRATEGPALAERFRRTAHTGLMVLKQPLGTRRRVGGRNWTGEKLLHWLRLVDPTFPLVTQAVREVWQEGFAVRDVERCLHLGQGQPVRLRRLTEPSPFVVGWLPTENIPAAAPPLEEVLRTVATERRSVHAAGT